MRFRKIILLSLSLAACVAEPQLSSSQVPGCESGASAIAKGRRADGLKMWIEAAPYDDPVETTGFVLNCAIDARLPGPQQDELQFLNSWADEGIADAVWLAATLEFVDEQVVSERVKGKLVEAYRAGSIQAGNLIAIQILSGASFGTTLPSTVEILEGNGERNSTYALGVLACLYLGGHDSVGRNEAAGRRVLARLNELARQDSQVRARLKAIPCRVALPLP